jgi:hypothetical protein
MSLVFLWIIAAVNLPGQHLPFRIDFLMLIGLNINYCKCTAIMERCQGKKTT